jgi:hypothetical protein
MKLTLEQLKENFLNEYIIEKTEMYQNNDRTIDDEEKEDLDNDIEELKGYLSDVESIEDMACLFDDERYSSWDVQGMIVFALKTCVE